MNQAKKIQKQNTKYCMTSMFQFDRTFVCTNKPSGKAPLRLLCSVFLVILSLCTKNNNFFLIQSSNTKNDPHRNTLSKNYILHQIYLLFVAYQKPYSTNIEMISVEIKSILTDTTSENRAGGVQWCVPAAK